MYALARYYEKRGSPPVNHGFAMEWYEEAAANGLEEAQRCLDRVCGMPDTRPSMSVKHVKALYNFKPSQAGEVGFKKDDAIKVLQSTYKDWWEGSLHGKRGIFPVNYVEEVRCDPERDIEAEWRDVVSHMPEQP